MAHRISSAPHDSGAVYPGCGYSHAEEDSARVSRWTSIVYLIVALAAPALVYFGPDVMSPAAPVIATQALDGHLAIHRASAPPAARAAKPPLAAIGLAHAGTRRQGQ